MPNSFLDELRARLPVSQVVGRHVSLKKRGREFVGLSPFNKEKSPSFTVNDQKGFYHCFSSGEHGDIFTFTMKMENLGFREAVERLASEAGMDVPQETRADREREAHRDRLLRLTDAVCRFYEEQLTAPVGREALDYLTRRGLDRETIGRFRLGYAPRSGDHLSALATSIGMSSADLVECGLAKDPEDGRAPYAFFRDRVLFPVADRRGRVVSFGGRILSGEGPKYINGPDTDLFHKGRLLYGLERAHSAAARGRQVIIAEGYMDVIALVSAGFEASVAPLGTAVTEAQIETAWRMHPEPVLCLDGDNAGRKAAWRAAERILPLLRPDHTVRIAFLPDGEDPDTLIKSGGSAAMQAVLEKTVSLADVLFERELTRHKIDDPEGRAGLKRALFELAGTIQDRDIGRFYGDGFAERVETRFRPQRADHGGNRRPIGPSRDLRGGGRWGRPVERHQLVGRQLPTSRSGGGQRDEMEIVQLLLATVIRYPVTAERLVEIIAEMDISDRGLSGAKDIVFEFIASGRGAECADLDDPDAAAGAELEQILVDRGYADQVRGLLTTGSETTPAARASLLHRSGRRPEAALETAETAWRHFTVRRLRAELEEARFAFRSEATDVNLERVKHFQKLLEEASTNYSVAFRAHNLPGRSS